MWICLAPICRNEEAEEVNTAAVAVADVTAVDVDVEVDEVADAAVVATTVVVADVGVPNINKSSLLI